MTTQWTVKQIADAVRSKKISAVEVTKTFLERAQKLDGRINSFITLNPTALQEAQVVDQKIQRGEDPGYLAGVPMAVKDLFCTKNLKTTAASKILGNFIPPYTATCVARLQDQGAVVLGKTNMDEFAMGSSNETSAFGTCHNPWNLDYVAGGSSGGSAAAVAAEFAPAALGSDTGGSIRQPASFCGLVGVKPTYGRISRYGMVAFASSLDQAGPMAKTVEDCTLLLDAMCGHDEKDSTTTLRTWSPLRDSAPVDIKRLTVGIPKEYFEGSLDEEIKKSFWTAVENLKHQGVQFVDVSLPNTPYSVPVYYMVATSEASSNLSRYDGVRYGYRAKPEEKDWADLDELYAKTRTEGFGAEVKRRIILGTFALSSGYYDAYYSQASRVRRLIQNDFTEAFASCDLIMGPVTTSAAFKTGTRINDPVQMYLNDIFTTSVNLAGLPALSVPVGLNSQGLPLGVQVMAPHFAEAPMLSLASAIEAASDMKNRRAHGLQ